MECIVKKDTNRSINELADEVMNIFLDSFEKNVFQDMAGEERMKLLLNLCSWMRETFIEWYLGITTSIC